MDVENLRFVRVMLIEHHPILTPHPRSLKQSIYFNLDTELQIYLKNGK